jgi:hypothetical protein
MEWRAVLTRVRECFGALDRVAAIARALDLANKLDLNFDLPGALQAAQLLAIVFSLDARTPSQARDLASGLVRDLARALDTDYTLHRDLAVHDAAVTARKLAQVLNRALGSDDHSDCTAAAGLDLSRDLVSALASGAALLRALADYPDFDDGRDLTRDLTRYRDLAQSLVRYLDSQSATPGEIDAEGVRSLPRAMRVAVWLLPRPWQARYSQEYRAELAYLPPWERSAYAWQVLKEVRQLRKELVRTECPPDHARAEE